jgi:hypothetical protein
MPTPPFRLQAITRRPRHEVTRAAERAIRGAGGWVTGFRQFSNAAVVLDVEVAPGRLAALYGAVEAEGMRLRPPLGDLPLPPADQDEVAGTLRIEFVHDEPDLRIDVPAVPG